jgi:hypothetical protein
MRNQPGPVYVAWPSVRKCPPTRLRLHRAADDDPSYLGASDFEAILVESVWGASKARFPTKIQEGLVAGISGGRAGDRVPCRAVCS